MGNAGGHLFHPKYYACLLNAKYNLIKTREKVWLKFLQVVWMIAQGKKYIYDIMK